MLNNVAPANDDDWGRWGWDLPPLARSLVSHKTLVRADTPPAFATERSAWKDAESRRSVLLCARYSKVASCSSPTRAPTRTERRRHSGDGHGNIALSWQQTRCARKLESLLAIGNTIYFGLTRKYGDLFSQRITPRSSSLEYGLSGAVCASQELNTVPTRSLSLAVCGMIEGDQC